MPTFAVMCFDKPGSQALRMATRPAHLEFADTIRPQIIQGGALLDEAGEMCGTLILLEAESLAAAKAINAADPYTQAGLFERVEVRGLRTAIGKA